MDSPDWRVTQKWISVEVPWHAEFEEKFRIVLKKESPVVLVLSQLDDRYFDGLQGQYSFRLQFRLHEVDSPGEEDYIVRSHGNYLMERSVVTELKSLAAGTYSVFVQVVADRDTQESSVEDVVKAQCRRKVDNDKLAQVGAMYDLAHSKGAVHIESRAAARRAQDKAKARESRIATRKKNWEKRHLSREIVRKQDKKNREKRERKEMKDTAEAKEKEEKEPKDKAVQTEDIKEVKFEKEDKAIQTEEISLDLAKSSPDNETQPINETDKGVQTEDMSVSSSDSQGTPETPKSSSMLNSPPRHLLRIPHHGGPPPPPPPYGPRDRKNSMPPRIYPRGPPQRSQYITSDGESSASPISDYDDMYSDDDPTLKPRPINSSGSPRPDASKRGKDSDDEDEPEPWNAVCIVGLRVYSKDEGLEVRIFENGVEEGKSTLSEQDEEGTDVEIEDGHTKEKEKGDEQGKDAMPKERDEPGHLDDLKNKEEGATLSIRTKNNEELALVDGEKKALALGDEESTAAVDSVVLVEQSIKPDEQLMGEDKKVEVAVPLA